MAKLFTVILIYFSIHIDTICVGKNYTCNEANEIYIIDPNASACQPTCLNRNLVCIKHRRGWERCRCMPYYIRDIHGSCVQEDRCMTDPNQCGSNEELLTEKRCKPGEVTCRTRMATWDDSVCQSGCYCIPDYYRNDKGVCTPEDNCGPIDPDDFTSGDRRFTWNPAPRDFY